MSDTWRVYVEINRENLEVDRLIVTRVDWAMEYKGTLAMLYEGPFHDVRNQLLAETERSPMLARLLSSDVAAMRVLKLRVVNKFETEPGG